MDKNLNVIAEELFNKIRGRFPSVTIGNDEGKVTNVPTEARFFDFNFTEGANDLGKVSISLEDKAIAIMYSNSFITAEDTLTKNKWYDFLKEIRFFAKKRLLNFDTRDITKSNLNKRDYKFLASNTGEQTMSESKLYGTSRISYQDVDSARINIRHNRSVNPDLPAGRTQYIETIYIESSDGERFKYPYKHLSGARAMARHVAEGGKPYDKFGTQIVGLSEELAKLKKFKMALGRNNIMAEGLSEYTSIVTDRIEEIKEGIFALQTKEAYEITKETFEHISVEEKTTMPDETAANWIDQLTVKQFNEELKDTFPFVYRLVKEKTTPKELNNMEDLLGENQIDEIAGPVIKVAKELFTAAGFSKKIVAALATVGGLFGLKKLLEITSLKNSPLGKAIKAKCDSGDPTTIVDSNGKELGWCEHYDLLDLYAEADNLSIWTLHSIVYDDSPYKNNPFVIRRLNKGQSDESNDTIDVKFGKDGSMEKADDKPKIPVSEFILSLFDREQGTFPKGETAVLTAVEKDYGEQYINPAKQFIEKITTKFEELNTEGNAYAHAVRKAKMNGKKKGDVVDGPDGDKIELEKFDPRQEQSREAQAMEELMTAYEQGGEESLAKEMGITTQELDQEINEMGREHNLHPDDDRDEIIERVVEATVDNADWEEQFEAMQRLAGLDSQKKRLTNQS